MKRLFFVPFLLVLFCVGVAWAADSGARFSSVNGQVETRPDADEDAWKLSKLETILNVRDHIRTQEDSSAVIGFADMSTFVLKPESEVVVTTPPEKDSKVRLVAGNIWVNVKKMVKDGSMEIEMNQAVAGIKGTNITCGTRIDEDRIQVLRGEADILIRESQQHIFLKEGEELIVKAGGKTEKIEINVQEESKKWEKELSAMGDSILMNEVPETLRELLQSESEGFKGIQDTFKTLTTQETVTDDEAHEFKKDVERFSGVLMEDLIILSAIQIKIDKAMSDQQSDKTMLAGYSKLVGSARIQQQSYQAEVAKMLKADFKKAAGADTGEIEAIAAEANNAWNDVQSLMTELSGNSSGVSQDWFKDATEKCNNALKTFAELQNRAQAVLDRNPTDQAGIALLKQLTGYQTQIGKFMRSLTVVEVPAGAITEMQQSEDELNQSLSGLRDKLAAYNDLAKTGKVQDRLRSSLSILNDFSKARRMYQNAQRLSDSILRSAGSQKNLSAEQEELKAQFERISNTFQELGTVADQLQTQLNDLESQLGNTLNTPK